MLKRIFGSIIDVRRGEVAITALMFFYYYLLLVTYYFLKPARDSLFLVKLGAEQLPIVFMLIAVIVVPVITVYSRASRKLKLNQLINLTTVVLISNLLILRFLLELPQSWVFYTFYIWVSIYGALSTAQFWLLANGVFDATQAKRIFVLFGLGGIVGAFTGGEITSIIVNSFDVSTEDLLFFCMAFLGICILVVNAVWRIRPADDQPSVSRKKAERKQSYAEIYKSITRSRHLLLIVGIIAATMATASFVDYQFKTISVQSFQTKPELTSFLGKFYGRLSLISFLFQLLISYRFLRWFGVGGAIMLLPLGLLMGTMWLIAVPGLIAATVLRGADGVFKYSIDKTGRELLFLPVPLEVKKQTKVFIDIFVDRWFRGFAGGILLLLVTVGGMNVQQLGYVVLGLLAIWLTMVFKMRKEYVNAFRLALERREIDLDDIRFNIAESSTLKTLKASLESSNERQIVYALEMLKGVQDAEILGAVQPLLVHGSSEVRLRTTELLAAMENDEVLDRVRERLEDMDPNVRIVALKRLCSEDSERQRLLKQLLQEDDAVQNAVAVSVIGAQPASADQPMITGDVLERLVAYRGEHDVFVRGEVAAALAGMPQHHGYLHRLLDDPSPDVADRAMLAIARAGDRDQIPQLVDRLNKPEHRAGARRALATFGDRVVGTLSDYIADPRTNFNKRVQLTRTLSAIPSQHAVDSLIALLDHVEPEVRFHVIKALNKLREQRGDLSFNHDALSSALVDETESYHGLLQVLQCSSQDSPADALLYRAVQEKIKDNLERIFRIVGLSYKQKDVFGAYLGITSSNKQLRASAYEFLDNVLKKQTKKYLLPIIEDIGMDTRIRKGEDLFGLRIGDRTEALSHLIDCDDPWLRACAIYGVRNDDPALLVDRVKKAQADPQIIVRDTAAAVTLRLAS